MHLNLLFASWHNTLHGQKYLDTHLNITPTCDCSTSKKLCINMLHISGKAFHKFWFIPKLFDGVDARALCKPVKWVTGKNTSLWTSLCAQGHCHLAKGFKEFKEATSLFPYNEKLVPWLLSNQHVQWYTQYTVAITQLHPLYSVTV